ncbi:MAG: fimbrillin family protein [Paludibacteraceae bacterium]|nr:fimbrillin family protein [Paludibacteraceae bacterium]
MKKFLFFALAAAFAFTSCTQDETLATAQNGAIDFAVAADKATRSIDDPSITTKNITNFAVYGFMEDYTGVVFRDELVSGSNDAGWSYQNTQYWVVDKNYYFAALAPSNDRAWTLTEEAKEDNAKLGIGQVNFKNDGKQDLLYWAGTQKGLASGNPKVGILFNHLLSKVKFSFVNQFDNPNAKIVVKNIVINDAAAEANIDLATNTWWTNLDAWTYVDGVVADYAFGNATTVESEAQQIAQYGELESFHEMLLFPQENEKYNITFTVELWMTDVMAATYDHEVELEHTFKMGYAYDLKATFNNKNITDDPNVELEPIEFEVTVKDWDQPSEDVNLNYVIYENGTTVAADATETLTSDAVVSGAMVVNGTLDGAGFTITPSNPVVESGMYSLINLKGGNATVKNLAIDGQNMVSEETDAKGNPYGIRAINVREAGTYTLENVRVYNVTYPLHVATTADVTLNVTNSVLEGWTSYNPETTVDFTGVSFENGTYARLRPYGNTTLTNCSFEAGFVIDLKYLAEGKKVTFVNCKYADQPLTAENLTDAVAGKYEIQ